MNINDSRNQVILDGYLADKPELKEVGDKKVAKMRLATNESYKPEGATERVEKAYFHDVTAWGKQAEFAGTLEKGMAVTVWGKLISNEKSVGKDEKTYYNTYVRAEVLKRGYNSDKKGKEEEGA